MKNLPLVTKNLLIVNVLMFFAMYAFKAQGIDLNDILALHFAAASNFRIYQFFTYMFMHSGFQHILFNMFALWMFGRVIEEVFGSRRFLIYYIVCGIGAGLVQEMVQYIDYFLRVGTFSVPDYFAPMLNAWRTVGASGAIYGILLAFGMTFPEEKMFIIPIPVPIKAKYFVMGYAALELFLAVAGSTDGVAHMAHVGGMLFGWILLRYWRGDRRNFLSDFQEKLTSLFRTRKKTVRGGGRFADEMDYNARRKAQDEEIDRILDKVKKHGYGSLTEAEKRKLFNASGRK